MLAASVSGRSLEVEVIVSSTRLPIVLKSVSLCLTSCVNTPESLTGTYFHQGRPYMASAEAAYSIIKKSNGGMILE